MTSTDSAVFSKPTARPAMIVVAGPVLLASAISRTGRKRARGVVLRDEDESEAVRMPTRPQQAKTHQWSVASTKQQRTRAAKMPMAERRR